MNGSPDTHRIVEVTVILLHDAIHPDKTVSRNLTQRIGTLPENIDAGWAEEIVDLQCSLWCQLKRCQQSNDSPEFSALSIGLLDFFQTFRCDAPNLQKPLRCMLNHSKGIDTKPSNDLRCCLGADILEQSRVQIIQNTLLRFRNDLAPLVHLKLHTIFAGRPLPFQYQFNRISHGYFITDCCKTDQMVRKESIISGACGHRTVRRLHSDNTILAVGILKNLAVKGTLDSNRSAFFTFIVFRICYVHFSGHFLS